MKKLIVALALVLATSVVFAQVLKGSRQVLVNGKNFANAQFVNGQWAISLEDFARLGGANVTLEPYFRLQGNELIGLLVPAVRAQGKVFPKIEASSSANTIGGTTFIKGESQKFSTTTKDKDSPQLGMFHVNRAGVISSHVFMVGGKAYIPLADIARAFGAPLTPAALKPAAADTPTESLSLNFTKIQTSTLAMNR